MVVDRGDHGAKRIENFAAVEIKIYRMGGSERDRCESQSERRDKHYGERLYAAPRTALSDQPQGGIIFPSHDSFYSSHDIFYRLGVRRRDDLETAVAFRATPTMKNVPLIPILG